MNKKIGISLIIVIVLLLTMSCYFLNTANSRNAKAYEVIKQENGEYHLQYNNEKGEGLFSTIYAKEPTVEYISDGVIKSWVSAGTSTLIAQYYDTRRRILSDEYVNPLIEADGKVLLLENKTLILEDIFSKSKYYKTYPIDSIDKVDPIWAILDVKIINDKISVKYIGKDDKDKEIMIPISE